VAHPFVPALLMVWALSVALRSCGVTAATLPPEREAVRSVAPEAAPVTGAPAAPEPRARG
jgi:hypothetical protein